MGKLGLKANGRRGGLPQYEAIGDESFKCRSCKAVKPLRQRNGTVCRKCTHERSVSTKEGALRNRYSQKKCRARKKGVPFTLTFEDFSGQYEQQNGRDFYTGEQMSFNFGNGRSAATMSMDRVDNNKGYTPGNVVFCCLSTNAKKGNRPVSRLIEQLEFDFSGGVEDSSHPKSKKEPGSEK